MNELKIFQKGWNYSQDGPGNRLVYHLQGCNMRCPWCSNPEGFSPDGTLMVHEAELLDEVCPHGAIHNKVINRERCNTCRTRECVVQNKNLGIRFSCQTYLVERLIDEAVQARSLFYDGGGVTLTGGEATLQFAAVKKLYAGLRAAEINTALETNGTHPRLFELFQLLDTLLIDLKHYDSRIHREKTGVGNETILANISKAVREEVNVAIRIPLIPGFNDSSADAERFAALLQQLPKSGTPVEVLPYHEYGKIKWGQCGLEYPLHTAGLPPENRQAFAAVLRENGLNLVRT